MRPSDRLKPERIGALTRLVFGVGLASSAVQLTVHPPVGPFRVLTNILEFTVGFTLVISVWVSYCRIVATPPVESSWLLALNAALVIVVGIEPFLIRIVGIGIFRSGDECLLDLSSVASAVGLALMVGILGAMTRCIGNDPALPSDREPPRGFCTSSDLRVLAAGPHLRDAPADRPSAATAPAHAAA